MINLGSNWNVVHWPDNWTATTVDGKRSAQFEETLLYVLGGIFPNRTDVAHLARITETGVEILTAAPNKLAA
jgi:methionyl aminopeptidase